MPKSIEEIEVSVQRVQQAMLTVTRLYDLRDSYDSATARGASAIAALAPQIRDAEDFYDDLARDLAPEFLVKLKNKRRRRNA